MWDRIWRGTFLAQRPLAGLHPQPAFRAKRRLLVEVLEDRQLMAASLAPLSNVTVPAQLGDQVSLNGSGNTDPTQTYTVTSDNPRIAASVAQGPYWTLNVQHNASSTAGDISFAGALTFQLFQDLLGNASGSTISEIQTFTNDGYYTGKDFTRIANNFPGVTDFVAQGGAPNPDGTGNSGQPGTPFADQFVQQLAFTGTQQLAMANAGPNTNDTQFFVTTGTPTFLDFKHTIFGQLVAGSNILADMTQVSTQANPALGGEKSLPVSPITINSATLSNTNVNGVIHLDTTSAKAGDTANITVTATDPTDGSHVTESFKVTVSAYNGPTTNATVPINFVPFANPVSSTTQINSPVSIQLSGTSGFPDTTTPGTLTFKLLSQPAHGTISNFSSTAGTLTYTPNTNSFGPDSFQYQVISTGPKSTPATTVSLPATVTVTVGAGQTGAVRLIHNVLVVTPVPRTRTMTDNIDITQQADSTVTGGQKIVVTVNGIPDVTQPAASSLTQIVVFGTKASDNIVVDPSVTVPATLDGGHAGHNVIKGGGGPTREHGWFGHTVLVGGVGSNELIGRRGLVRFQPSSTTTLIFAGAPKPRFKHRTVRPGGTYYRFTKGHLIPVKSF
jgi:cyclophilin family peptidyl-prolyl cis-trans isomerase